MLFSKEIIMFSQHLNCSDSHIVSSIFSYFIEALIFHLKKTHYTGVALATACCSINGSKYQKLFPWIMFVFMGILQLFWRFMVYYVIQQFV